MSAAFDADEHLPEILETAIRLAPMCTNGIDFSNTGGESRYGHGGKSDMQTVIDRAWEAGKAMVEKYHAEVEAAGVRAAVEERREMQRREKEAAHV